MVPTSQKSLLFGTPPGMLFGLVVHAADVQDRDGAPAVLKAIRHTCPWLRHLFADGGYAGPKLRGALDRIGKWTLEIVKRSDTARSLPPRRRGASKSCPDDGSSNAPLHGSGDVGGWQKTGRNPPPPARHGSTSPISDSQRGGSQGLASIERVSSQALRPSGRARRRRRSSARPAPAPHRSGRCRSAPQRGTHRRARWCPGRAGYRPRRFRR